MASLYTVRRMLCAAADGAAAAAAAAPKGRWERLKSSKAGVWCRSLLSDYREACREMVVGAWERPLRSSAYGALLAGVWACFHTNPGRCSFEAALLERSNQLGLLSAWTRSAAADGHVQSLARLREQGRLGYASLGLLSLVYRAENHGDTMLFEARCPDLAAPWRELPGRVLDVGFTGRWWVLDSKMEDYDINEEEFKQLPAHMQETRPPGVEEVERNERLHRESWLPVAVEEEEDGPAVAAGTDRAGQESQTDAAREERT
ncbi:mitochondrial import inner membrane translocase subunit Tim29 [Menidia menidia]